MSTGDYVPYIVYDSYGEPAYEWERQADEQVERHAEQAAFDGPGPGFEPRPIPDPWLEPDMEVEAGQ